MEEVWKDYMSLSSAASLYHHSPPSPPSSYRAGNGILQDFLASAPVPPSLSAPQQPPTPPPLPPTTLSLSSTLEFTYLGGGGCSSTSGDDSRDLMSMPDPLGVFSFAPAPRNRMMDGSSGGDRWHRRMIKNRESAARSRARKQAYTNELELALAQLRRENEMLLKRHQELNVRLAMTAQVPDRLTVQRCRSAPP
ncbi:protein FD-like [Phragmites australis]|uniref:protein FD-like n=1 Tax=Phragmites australis TaxID=29695 RepID=UPI002D7879EC|nr:protein FD-like [Phragmites australis]